MSDSISRLLRTNEYFSSSDEGYGGSCAGCAWQTAGCLGPVLEVALHVPLGLQETFPVGKNVFISISKTFD